MTIGIRIMAYGSTPYVGRASKKIVAILKVYKWHAWNVCIRLVKGLHEPYQALPSAYMGNGTIYTLLKSITEGVPPKVSTPKMSTLRMSTPEISTPKMSTSQNVNSQNVNFLKFSLL